MRLFEEKPFIIKEDMPEYKITKRGPEVMTMTELLSLFFYDEYAVNVSMAHKILEFCEGDENKIYQLTRKQLMSIPGIGEARANAFLAMLEITKRLRYYGKDTRKKLTGSKDVSEIMSFIRDEPYEKFYCLFLNLKNYLLKVECVGEGGVTGTVADPKKIFRKALDANAFSMILCHNHPSGSPLPSQNDIQLTRKFKEAGALLDLPVLDNIIIGREGYYSFADEGLM